MIRIVKLFAIISFITMWSSSIVLADGIEKIAAGDKYNYEQIYISLPVYIVSMIATAGFIWTVAKYDNKRVREMSDLKLQILEMIKSSCKFPLGCDECPYKTICKIGQKELEN